MVPKWVEFVADEPPVGTEAIDAVIVDQWRAIVRDRLLFEGDANSMTGPTRPAYGRTLVAAVPVSRGRHLAVWWTFKNDEVATVLAIRLSEPDPDFEEPPDDLA